MNSRWYDKRISLFKGLNLLIFLIAAHFITKKIIARRTLLIKVFKSLGLNIKDFVLLWREGVSFLYVRVFKQGKQHLKREDKFSRKILLFVFLDLSCNLKMVYNVRTNLIISFVSVKLAPSPFFKLKTYFKVKIKHNHGSRTS